MFASTLVHGQNNLNNLIAGIIKLQADGAGAGDTSVASGTLRGDPVGVSTWVFDYTIVHPFDGECVEGTGHFVITTANGSTLNLSLAGPSCNAALGGPPPGSPGTSNLTYVVAGGTGRFTNALGTGNLVLTTYNNGAPNAVYVHLDGNLDLH
jgi:hypothetical protein